MLLSSLSLDYHRHHHHYHHQHQQRHHHYFVLVLVLVLFFFFCFFFFFFFLAAATTTTTTTTVAMLFQRGTLCSFRLSIFGLSFSWRYRRPLRSAHILGMSSSTWTESSSRLRRLRMLGHSLTAVEHPLIVTMTK